MGVDGTFKACPNIPSAKQVLTIVAIFNQKVRRTDLLLARTILIAFVWQISFSHNGEKLFDL